MLGSLPTDLFEDFEKKNLAPRIRFILVGEVIKILILFFLPHPFKDSMVFF
jgi:hypothetical protein